MASKTTSDIVLRLRRRKRIELIKKLIIVGLCILILLPIVLCSILFFQMNHLEKQIQKLQVKQMAQTSIEQTVADVLKEGEVPMVSIEDEEEPVIDRKEAVSENTISENTLSGNTINVYLTFDDGPSSNTEDILDILKFYDVKATFFVVGKPEKEYAPLYERIVTEGHAIGMHSYSHKYKEIYADVESFAKDLEQLQDLIYERTGVRSMISRFPGGSSNTVSSVDMGELVAYLEKEGITYYDWNVSSLDAESGKTSVIQIVENVVENIQNYQNAIVLLHDANDKKTTVEALPIIIECLNKMGNVNILPITEETVKIQHQIKNE